MHARMYPLSSRTLHTHECTDVSAILQNITHICMHGCICYPPEHYTHMHARMYPLSSRTLHTHACTDVSAILRTLNTHACTDVSAILQNITHTCMHGCIRYPPEHYTHMHARMYPLSSRTLHTHVCTDVSTILQNITHTCMHGCIRYQP